jgi:cytochrome bd-type quinol oxidase subunit 1
MSFNIKFWLKISLINLLIVASLGVLMRYKIGFDFPYFSQKNIQHAHSHFAFAGWITHALYVLMIHYVLKKLPLTDTKNYKRIIIANLICSYGMLFSFSYNGYSTLSIILSTITIIIACFFAFYYFKDLENINDSNPSKSWFKAALLFNIISSVFSLYLFLSSFSIQWFFYFLMSWYIFQ